MTLPVLDEATRRFMQGRVSIIVSTADAGRRSNLVRAIGCRVDADEVCLFLTVPQSAQVLSDIRAGSAVAVVFSEPHSHRTVQIKSRGATIGTPEPGDDALLERYACGFELELALVGLGPAFARTIIRRDGGGVVTLRLQVEAAFQQTPGPQAGQPLHGGGA